MQFHPTLCKATPIDGILFTVSSFLDDPYISNDFLFTVYPDIDPGLLEPIVDLHEREDPNQAENFEVEVDKSNINKIKIKKKS